MKFSNITNLNNPTLRIIKNNRKLEFPIKIKEARLNKDINLSYICIDTKRIKFKGRIISLNLNSTDANLSLYCTEGKTVFKWDNIKVVTLLNYGKKETFIFTNCEYGVSCDRRKFKRYDLEKKAFFYINEKKIPAKVNDISLGGFSISINDTEILQTKNETFVEIDGFEKIPVKIVRSTITKNGQELGCFVSKEYKTLLAHIIKNICYKYEDKKKNKKAEIHKINDGTDSAWNETHLKRWHN